MRTTSTIAAILIALALAVGGVALAVGGGDETELPTVDTTTDDGGFVGLSLADAVAKAETNGDPWRIAREDDEAFALTDDLVPGRVTFEVDGGVVTSALIEEPVVASPDDPVAVDAVRADLIADAVKRLLTVDNSFGGHDVFDDVRVGSAIGGDPTALLEPIDLDFITAAVSDIGSVQFVDDTNAVIESLFEASPQGVAVVTVERILLLDDRAEVEMRLWCGSLCGVMLTYEAVPEDGGWRILGVTGPIAMS
jgi:hypothetical protein